MKSSKPIIGCDISEHNYSWIPIPRDFVWDACTPEQCRVVVLSDHCIKKIDKYSHVPKKVAWMMESPHLWQYEGLKTVREFILSNLDKFDRVMTTEMQLVRGNPQKFVYQNQSIPQVMPYETKIYEKVKFCSVMVSEKNFRPGHRLRHLIAGKYKGIVHPLGYAWKPVNRTWEGYADYMFSVVSENCKVDNYFSNQILDPIACGTIPIYWGSPSISATFNSKGIIEFDTIEQFEKIISNLSPDDYWLRMDAVRENLEIVNKWHRLPEYTMWKNVLKELYESTFS